MLGRAIKIRERFASPEMNLANTAAVEHFTATFAEIALSDEKAGALAGDSVVGDLMAWHALEESEHKAVAFDVYKAVGGSERTRVLTMNIVTVMFLTVLTLQTTLSILRDPATYRRGNLRRSLKRLRRSPFARKEVWRRLRDYNRPDFHPDDRDTTELVAYWREEFFGADGNLNDRLVSGSAA